MLTIQQLLDYIQVHNIPLTASVNVLGLNHLQISEIACHKEKDSSFSLTLIPKCNELQKHFSGLYNIQKVK